MLEIEQELNDIAMLLILKHKAENMIETALTIKTSTFMSTDGTITNTEEYKKDLYDHLNGIKNKLDGYRELYPNNNVFNLIEANLRAQGFI